MMVKRLLELLSHHWAPPRETGALTVKAPAPGSIWMPMPPTPYSESVLPLIESEPPPVL